MNQSIEIIIIVTINVCVSNVNVFDNNDSDDVVKKKWLQKKLSIH